MKHQWYCGVEGQQYGPYTWEQMRAMAEEGRLISDTYVRRGVDQQWLTAAQIPGLLKKRKPAGGSTTTTAAKKVSKSSAPAAVTAPPVVAEPPLPVGTAVAPEPAAAPPVGVVVQASPPAQAAAAPNGEDDDAPAKQSQTLLMVGALAGVVLFVGGIAVGLLVWRGMRTSPASQTAAAQPASEAPAVAAAPAAESNPVEINPVDIKPTANESDSVSSATAAKQVESSAAAAPALAAAPPQVRPADAAAAAKVLKSITSWSDATRSTIKLLDVSLKVNGAWLADESGARVEPGNSAARYVFVELRLANSGQITRSYKSWNATAGASAVLADAAGQPLAFVPPSATPPATRAGAVQIPPGGTVTDQLVFYAPTAPPEKLRLALAKSALAGNAKTARGTHFAFEITREALLKGALPAQPASDPAAVPAAGALTAPPAPPVTDRNVLPPSETLQPLTPAAPNTPPATPPPAPAFDPKAFDKELQKDNAPPPPADKPGKGPTGK